MIEVLKIQRPINRITTTQYEKLGTKRPLPLIRVRAADLIKS